MNNSLGFDFENIRGAVKARKGAPYIKIIERNIRHILAQYGLDDSEWAQAISSQYFLLSIAKMVQWNKKDYENLMNRCLSCFNVTYTGNYVLDDSRLLITPDETLRIIECMQREDDIDSYYTRSAKMKAKNIDSQRMYFNYHYGLLIKIVSAENTKILQAIKNQCLDRIIDEKALDYSDGWYPYRVPWITARILISLKEVDFSDYSEREKLDDIINSAIDSLYQRIDEKFAYWRSGVGDWVSKWESTALCLEALYVWNEIRVTEVKRIVEYICTEEHMNEWLNLERNFTSEDSANSILSSVVLASIIYRVTKKYYPDLFEKTNENIIIFFNYVIRLISNNCIEQVRQYCTIPQILYYILSAIKS